MAFARVVQMKKHLFSKCFGMNGMRLAVTLDRRFFDQFRAAGIDINLSSSTFKVCGACHNHLTEALRIAQNRYAHTFDLPTSKTSKSIVYANNTIFEIPGANTSFTLVTKLFLSFLCSFLFCGVFCF